jgi:hypothetical protein
MEELDVNHPDYQPPDTTNAVLRGLARKVADHEVQIIVEDIRESVEPPSDGSDPPLVKVSQILAFVSDTETSDLSLGQAFEPLTTYALMSLLGYDVHAKKIELAASGPAAAASGGSEAFDRMFRTIAQVQQLLFRPHVLSLTGAWETRQVLNSGMTTHDLITATSHLAILAAGIGIAQERGKQNESVSLPDAFVQASHALGVTQGPRDPSRCVGLTLQLILVGRSELESGPFWTNRARKISREAVAAKKSETLTSS